MFVSNVRVVGTDQCRTSRTYKYPQSGCLWCPYGDLWCPMWQFSIFIGNCCKHKTTDIWPCTNEDQCVNDKLGRCCRTQNTRRLACKAELFVLRMSVKLTRVARVLLAEFALGGSCGEGNSLNGFMVPTVPQAQPSARILVQAADGILAFNVDLLLTVDDVDENEKLMNVIYILPMNQSSFWEQML